MKASTSSLFICILISFISCTDQKPLFKAQIIHNETFKNVSYEPNMAFTEVIDSSYSYFSKEDYNMVLTGTISKGETIYSSDKFELKVMLRTHHLVDRDQYEFVLRTFSKDFKIIDSYVMASTLKDLACEGSINNDLVITTTCEDGNSRKASIDEYGKFIEQ